jgi:hypothetical protein
MLKLANIGDSQKFMLTVVTEFRLEVEILKHHGDLMM